VPSVVREVHARLDVERRTVEADVDRGERPRQSGAQRLHVAVLLQGADALADSGAQLGEPTQRLVVSVKVVTVVADRGGLLGQPVALGRRRRPLAVQAREQPVVARG
jgi:hypothetical protein